MHTSTVSRKFDAPHARTWKDLSHTHANTHFSVIGSLVVELREWKPAGCVGEHAQTALAKQETHAGVVGPEEELAGGVAGVDDALTDALISKHLVVLVLVNDRELTLDSVHVA